MNPDWDGRGIHLNVVDTRLIARAEELATLEDAFRKISTRSLSLSPSNQSSDCDDDEDDEHTNCILVSGKSGCGKTKLVQAFRDTLMYSGRSYVSGKFDQLSNTQPCSAFWDAVAEIFDPCNLTLDDSMKQEIRGQLDTRDLQLLLHFVPPLRGLLQEEDGPLVGEGQDDEVISQYEFIRIMSMVRKLFRVITSFSPLVMFLDDLQWSDADSIDMIQSLLSDVKLRRFMFVGAYRTDGDTPSQTYLQKFSSGVTIRLLELSESNVDRLLSSVLRLEHSSTKTLAQHVHRKTAGNCFFVIQYLQLLEKKDLLKFSYSENRWVWDLERIVAETESCPNVVGIVRQKLQYLSTDTKATLAVAACFGNKFAADVVRVVMHMLQREDEGSNDQNRRGLDDSNSSSFGYFDARELKAKLGVESFRSDIVAVLKTAIKEGLIDEMPQVGGTASPSMSVYKFVHDQIQAEAYRLIATGDREGLHMQLGKILWTQMLPKASGDDHDALLLQIADQLSFAKALVSLEPKQFRVRVSNLNLQAARSVRRNGAFLTAAQYLQHSAVLLGRDKWSSHYQLTLEILNLQAEMYFCCGKGLECKSTVTEILSSATCIEDKLDAYGVLVDCLGSQKDADEAKTTTFAVVSQMGFSAPKRKSGIYHVVRQLHKTRKAVKRYSDEELVAYRECDNCAVEGCMKLLSRTASIAWMCGDTNDVAFISLLMCHISLTHGFTKFSSNSFAAFALVLIQIGDVQKGKRFGILALELADRFKASECDGQTMLLYYGWVHYMSTPMHSLLDPLIQTNRRAKAGGDIEHSHHACAMYTFCYIICGLPLSVVEEDAKEFISEMKQYKQSAALTHTSLYRQLALNLIHPSRDPYKMEGKEIGNLSALLQDGNESNNKRTREAILNCQLYLVCYLGRGEEGKRTVQDHANLKNHEYPIYYSTCCPYLRGMVFFRLARACATKRRYFRRRAAREIRQVKVFVRLGFVNCSHQLSILEAEMLAHRQRPDQAVKEAFDKAIAMSIRSGFPQDAGLTSEDAAFFFRDRNESWSAVFLERAVDHFQQWGAQAKIDRMRFDHFQQFAANTDELARADSGSFGSTPMSTGDGDGNSTVSSAIHGRSRRNSFYRNSDHQTTDWFQNTTSVVSVRKRRNLSVTKGTASFRLDST